MKDKEHLLEVKHLNSYYKNKSDKLFKPYERRQILKEIDFFIDEGEIVGLVGESGSGKSTLAKCILSLNKDIEGEIAFKTRNSQMVFQDPYGSLNPSKTIGFILEEPLRIRGGMTDDKRNAKVAEMIKLVGLDESFLKRKPSELSGGQRQRICIALALMTEPKLLIADEPVSALDVTVQAQILQLLCKLNKELHIAILFISHDLQVVYSLCDRVYVMKDGEIVESGDVDTIYKSPKYDYTKSLLAAAIGEEYY